MASTDTINITKSSAKSLDLSMANVNTNNKKIRLV